jgi:hypothetical protein
MKKIIVIVVLAAVAFFGYYAYKSLKKSAGGLSAENIKGLIESRANEAQDKLQGATDESLQDLRNQAGDVLKNKVDETLGTK